MAVNAMLLLNLLMVLSSMFMYYMAYRAGKKAERDEIEAEENEIIRTRDELAKRPDRDAAALLKWMRSPHSRF